MPSLTDLPPETLHQIAWELTSRFSRDPNDCFPTSLGFARENNGLIALSRLSRVSKYFREIAQPKLFFSTFDSQNKSVSLVKTLYSRQDLAGAVIELQVGSDGRASVLESFNGRYEFGPGNELDTSPADTLVLNKLLFEHFPPITKQQPPSEDDDRSDDDAPGISASAALAIALVPNVKRLFVETGYWSLPIYKPDSLRYLVELNIVFDDTERGFYLQNFRGILQAAPSLRTLGCHMVCGISDLAPHSNLRTLHINHSSLTKESFQHIAATFSQLENFSYSSAGAIVSDEEEATPRYMLDAPRKLGSTIKHLSIETEMNTFDMDLEPGDHIEDLTEMRILQSLAMSACAIVNSEVETDGNVFMDLLPPSICKLMLISPGDNLAKDINRLAESATERFPNLKNIAFQHLSSQPSVVEETPFTARGISCSNTGPMFSTALFPSKFR